MVLSSLQTHAGMGLRHGLGLCGPGVRMARICRSRAHIHTYIHTHTPTCLTAYPSHDTHENRRMQVSEVLFDPRGFGL